MLSLSKAEKAFIQAGLVAAPPSRADGRGLLDFRAVALETAVAPLANGSARLSIGRNPHDAGGGTEVVAATKLQVESSDDDNDDDGRIICTVSCSPSAYPHLSPAALDDVQADLTSLLQHTLAHPSLRPRNLAILTRSKSWLLHLDVLVLADAGNVLDALFMAARAALWDTRVPRTRPVEYRAPAPPSTPAGAGADEDAHETAQKQSGFDTRVVPKATDFELPDYWDDGAVLDGRARWPVALTLNLEPTSHFLDATAHEEAASPLKLLLLFSFPDAQPAVLQGTRLLGPGELAPARLKQLIQARRPRPPLADSSHADLGRRGIRPRAPRRARRQAQRRG
ncbi:hypothetical protein C0993_007595, partial [Termitomyces sp. T159_Od127]